LFSSELRGKNKTLKTNGIMLYTRDRHMIKNKHEVLYDVPGGFKKPKGIALSAEHLYVCDQDMACVFKMSIDSGEVIHTINIPNGKLKNTSKRILYSKQFKMDSTKFRASDQVYHKHGLFGNHRHTQE
jgi:hypothetical protein